MEGLKEYLEASTIHGLYYISTCKSTAAKAGWLLTVIIGFGSAGYFIQSSFSDWADSPVTTTITPHPVADLPFPEVTICPPKGINSALKYDLMMLANMTLNEQKKDKLEKQTKKAFSESGKTSFVKEMISLINKDNLGKVFEGFHEFPKETKDGFRIGLSGVKGSIQTPGYGQNFSLEQFMMYRGKVVHYELHVEDIKMMMKKNASLLVDVELDTNYKDEAQLLEVFRINTVPLKVRFSNFNLLFIS